MSATQSLLSTDKAIALRLLRTERTPHDFWLWLGGSKSLPIDPIAVWIDTSVLASIREITEPNLTDAGPQERAQAHQAEAWIAAILGFANRQSIALQLDCFQPLCATALLPLYRNLAVNRLAEALEHTRNRLAELLTLVGIAEESGEDFVQLLKLRGAPITSPYLILKSVLKLDLVQVCWNVRQFALAYDPETSTMESELLGKLMQQTSDGRRSESAWSEPHLLWQIASELMAKKADFVLPRQWADVAVPWTSISEHWNTLTHRLSHSKVQQSNDGGQDLGQYGIDDEIVSEMIDDVFAMQTDVSEVTIETNSSDDESEEPPSASEGASPSRTQGRSHSSHGAGAGAPRMDAFSVEEVDDDEELQPTDVAEDESTYAPPKIAIVEIASQSDRVFVSAVRRQIATARNEDRTACLVAAHVDCDGEVDSICATRASGLAIWQEKLVNWLADHPEVHEPFAFVTTEGQLVMMMLDIERTQATNVVREGMVTVLTGKRVDDKSALARVSTPASYFVGIASVTAPNANFTAEQLITPTWRCLSAAQGQGKATIKSIEVF